MDLHVGDEFASIKEVMDNVFKWTYKAYFKGYYPLDTSNQYAAWFPKLAVSNDGIITPGDKSYDWVNTMTQDGKHIFMNNIAHPELVQWEDADNMYAYHPGGLVLGSKHAMKWDQELFKQGEKPAILVDYPVQASDYEAVDLFNWQEKAKSMVSQIELTRRVSAQSETIERYIRDGKIVPDMEVPISDHRSFKYFNPERVAEFADHFGWKLITPANMKDMFMDMCKQMTMSYSYKPVFLIAFLSQMNEDGSARLDNIVQDFASYYENRIQQGLPAEKKTCIFTKDGYTDKDVERLIFVGGITETPPVVWQFYQGNWMDGAAIYKDWFETHLPEGLKRIAENPDLPAWYREMPIVLTYPVRGIHDMDKMEPNKLFPYDNVLPLVDEFAEKMHTKIMVLLMHWEGTAPWAPPFVWPPYGGEEMLLSFMDKLHKDGHLLGVYCSGLGWTEQSNLIAEYNTEKRFNKEKLEEAMCLSPEGELPHSRICTGQRSGYDICPASKKGKAILQEALTPLFDASLDYMQVMDQNHGGSMYFCYSKEHGHPAAPGPWMTKTMQDLTAAWKNACPNGLLGCESAAAEPYLGNLALSDNRYELNYVYGRAVPLHSFLYHEYLHNFMGNQVAAPFAYDTEGICYRLAYSFAAGDLLTLVLNDDGEIMFHWGMRDFSHHSDTERILAFCRSLHEAQRKYPQFLSDGRMVKPLSYTCEQTAIALTGKQKSIFEPSVLACAYEAANGEKMQFFVNYTDQAVSVTVEDKTLTVPALSYLDYRI